MIDIAVLRAMAARGASPEMIIDAVELAVNAARPASDEAARKRQLATDRQRRWRAKLVDAGRRYRDVTPPSDSPPSPVDKSTGPSKADLERDLFIRGKQVLGQNAGGMIARLLKSRGGDLALARSVVEFAATKQQPRQYVGAVLAGGHASENGRRLTNDEAYFGIGREPGII